MNDINLLGKDHLNEVEAAHYCCLKVAKFHVLRDAFGWSGPRYRKADLAKSMEWAAADPTGHRNFLLDSAAGRYEYQTLRTPMWADFDAIDAIYEAARRMTLDTGIAHHVDHEIPLKGVLVSGLHVHNNLQILTASENCRKQNKYICS